MRNGWIIVGIIGLPAIAVSLARAQAAQPPDRGQRVSILSSNSVLRVAAAGGEILREIDDPNNGDRWLLIRDADHSAGPARLVLVSTMGAASGTSRQSRREPDAPPPVIRAGDHLILEEHSAVVDARLEAVAMEPAWTGSAFNARLSVGGQRVRAVAAAPGRAILLEETRR